MLTEFQFPYGSSFLKAAVPTANICQVLQRKSAAGLADEAGAVTAALRAPIGSRPLVECVGQNSRVAVIVTDNTRACPDERLLPPILAELERKVRRENITIVVALGLHAPLSQAELAAKLGDKILENYRVINHDAQDVVQIGTTSRGIPVEINRHVVEADFRVSTGFIEPHFFAGFSGGSKSLMPGVSSAASIRRNHGFEMIDNPGSRAGVLRGNPIHEDIIEQAALAKLDFIVNVLLSDRKEITHVVAGHPVQAHEKGCEIEKTIVGVKVSRKADITITTNSGAPLDLDLYQTVKGIDNAAQITRAGGIIIIASACTSGVGVSSFAELHSACAAPEEVIRKIPRESYIGVSWQNQVLARAQIDHSVYLVSGLDAESVRKMLMTPVPSIEEGLRLAFTALGKDARVAVMPEGPLVLPLVED